MLVCFHKGAYNAQALKKSIVETEKDLPTRRDFLKTGMGALGLLSAGCAQRKGTSERPNVLWIVNDASRAKNYSCYGYGRKTSPHLDKLAQSGALFERAYSQAFYTGPSVSSYMTGSYFPSAVTSQLSYANFGRVKVLGVPENEVLAPLAFSAQGYHTLIMNGNLAFLDKTTRVTEAFDKCMTPEIDKMGRTDLPDSCLVKRTFQSVNLFMMDWFKFIAKQPFFVYLHTIDTHAPFVIPDRAPFNQWLDDSYSGKYIRDFRPTFSTPRIQGAKQVEREDADQLMGLYDGAINYSDHHLSLLFDSMDSAGLMDNTIIVYTSDHGEALLDDRKQWGHAWTLGGADETHHIPLLMSGPGIPKGKRVKSISQSIDILPTLMELCGLSADGYMDGESLVPLLNGEKEDDKSSVAVTTQGTPQTGDGVARLIITGKDYKYEYNFTDEEKEFLWSVPDALAARRNVIDTYRDQAKKMRANVELELIPRIELAAKNAIPVAFSGQLVSMAWDSLPENHLAWGEKELTEEKKNNWVLDARERHNRPMFCLPSAGTSEVSFEFLNDIVRGEHVVLIEVLASSNFRGEEASVFDVAVAEGEFQRIALTSEGLEDEWRFVLLGNHTFADNIVLRFRAANAAACLRRLLVYPDIPGAKEIVEKEFVGEQGLTNLDERTKELEALGYI
jgi:arylsulfatase